MSVSVDELIVYKVTQLFKVEYTFDCNEILLTKYLLRLTLK